MGIVPHYLANRYQKQVMSDPEFDSLTWEIFLKDEELDCEESKKIILDFFIPYKVRIQNWIVNQDCFEQRYSYSYDFQQGSTSSMIYWSEDVQTWEMPTGIPEWFIIAFPDVAKWIATEEGMSAINRIYGDAEDDEMSDANGYAKKSVLKTMIDLYIKHGHKLETAK